MKDLTTSQTVLDLPLHQHPNYAAMLALLGRGTDQPDLGPMAHALVQQRDFGALGRLRMVSHGPIHAADTTHADQVAALNILRDHRVQVINAAMQPPQVMRAAGYRQILTPVTHAQLTLDHDAQSRHDRMHGKWRNRLRAAKRSRLKTKIRAFHPATDLWLLSQEAKQQRSKSYRGWPGALTLAFAQANPQSVYIATAKQNRDVVAAMLFLCHRPGVSYHIGWTNAAGRATGAHNLLHDVAATYFADRAFCTMTLGLLDTQNAPDLARFKLGTGARPVRLGGTWLHLPGFRRRPLACPDPPC